MLNSTQPPPQHSSGPANPDHTDQPTDDTWDMPLPGQQAALDALRWHWGTAYHIGIDDGQWWYLRRDGKGGRETATTPGALRTMIITDYTTWPVPRDHHTSPDEPPHQPAPTEPTPL